MCRDDLLWKCVVSVFYYIFCISFICAVPFLVFFLKCLFQYSCLIVWKFGSADMWSRGEYFEQKNRRIVQQITEEGS